MGEKDKFNLRTEVYKDLMQPTVKTTGEIVSLIPRAIKVALAPVEQWIVQKERNLEETYKLLEEKLQNSDPKYIVTPELRIAVPALQAICYCVDNKELREMFANLLARSMTTVFKNDVHPSFVEIIKQLCPDEARILRYILEEAGGIPTISVWAEDKHMKYMHLGEYTNIAELAECEMKQLEKCYIDNLIRLGLIRKSRDGEYMGQEKLYAELMATKRVQDLIESGKSRYNHMRIKKEYIRLTDLGELFCIICLQYDGVRRGDGWE